jgi:hypothetical protein
VVLIKEGLIFVGEPTQDLGDKLTIGVVATYFLNIESNFMMCINIFRHTLKVLKEYSVYSRVTNVERLSVAYLVLRCNKVIGFLRVLKVLDIALDRLINL